MRFVDSLLAWTMLVVGSLGALAYAGSRTFAAGGLLPLPVGVLLIFMALPLALASAQVDGWLLRDRGLGGLASRLLLFSLPVIVWGIFVPVIVGRDATLLSRGAARFPDVAALCAAAPIGAGFVEVEDAVVRTDLARTRIYDVGDRDTVSVTIVPVLDPKTLEKAPVAVWYIVASPEAAAALPRVGVRGKVKPPDPFLEPHLAKSGTGLVSAASPISVEPSGPYEVLWAATKRKLVLTSVAAAALTILWGMFIVLGTANARGDTAVRRIRRNRSR